MRLGLDGGLFEHQVMTTSVPGGSAFGSSSQEVDVKTTTLGLASIPFGPVVAYGVSDNILLGTHLDLIHRSVSADGGSSRDSLGFAANLFASYVAGTGDVRPFIGPLLGIEMVDTDQGSSTTKEHLFTFNAQLGLHAFATSSFSIDPSLVAGYGVGGGSLEVADGFGGTGIDYDLSGFSIGLRLGVSGWIGGKGSTRRDDEPPERDLDAMRLYTPPYPERSPGYAPTPPQQQPPAPAYAPPPVAPSPGSEAAGAAPPPPSGAVRPRARHRRRRARRSLRRREIRR